MTKDATGVTCAECGSSNVTVRDEDEPSYVCEDCETVFFVGTDDEDGDEVGEEE